MAETPEDPSSGLLSGWGEIAAYVRKSERCVQRWEHERQLPIHRDLTAKGQTVYAYRHEIDAWRAANDGPPRHRSNGVPQHAAKPVPAVVQRRAWPALGTIGAVAAALVIGIVGGLAFVQQDTASADVPTTFVFVGQELEARDRVGRVVWTHDFGREVFEAISVSGVAPANAAAAQLDLDADGSMDTIVPVRFALRNQKPSVSDAVFVFSEDGTVKWTVRSPDSLKCPSDTLTGPWNVHAVAVSDEPGVRKLWVVFNHHTYWPGVVIEADATGRQSLRYIQTGWVRALTSWTTPSGTYLVAGGVTNEHEQPILAVIDTAGPAAMNQTSDPRFACDGLPTGRPRAVFLLPNDDLGSADGVAYGMVTDVRVVGDSVKATTVASRGGQIVELSPDLRITHFSFADSHWLAHRQLEAALKLDHSATNCPDRRERHIHSWTPLTGWQDHMITPAIRTAGESR